MYIYHLYPRLCRGIPLRGEVFPKVDEGRGIFARRSCAWDRLVVAATKTIITILEYAIIATPCKLQSDAHVLSPTLDSAICWVTYYSLSRRHRKHSNQSR